MLSDVMAYFGLNREFDQAGYFDTEHHQYLLREISATIVKGRTIVLAGIVGSGKTNLLRQLRAQLKKENQVVIARSLAIDKDRININVLMRAIAYDLAMDEKAANMPKQAEDREHYIVELIHKNGKPAVLFVDDAHDLHPQTLVRLKRLVETVRDEGETLSIVLTGHPKLKHDLRRPTLEEIGARAEVFGFDGIQGRQSDYIHWLLAQCSKGKDKTQAIIEADAIELLADRLSTALQINHYLTLALEQAFQIGSKKVNTDVIETVLAQTLNDPEPHLIRYGYNIKSLAQLINIKPAEMRSFLHGQLPPGRNQELKEQLLKGGVPL